MKRIIFTLAALAICVTIFGQRKTTTVRSYYRKDGTFVNSHTRHYNAGSSTSNSGYSYSGASSPRENEEIFETDLTISSSKSPSKIKKISGLKVTPTTLTADSNGVTIYVAVLRYNDSAVVDICPIPRSVLTYDYETSYTSLYFKIPKDRIKPEHIIELVSKYRFDLKDDFLTKSEYLGIGKIELPKYMNLKIEAITLK